MSVGAGIIAVAFLLAVLLSIGIGIALLPGSPILGLLASAAVVVTAAASVYGLAKKDPEDLISAEEIDKIIANDCRGDGHTIEEIAGELPYNRTKVRKRLEQLVDRGYYETEKTERGRVYYLNESDDEGSGLSETVISIEKDERGVDTSRPEELVYTGSKGEYTVYVNGDELDPRTDIVNHSVNGDVSWGYRGSGPAQLAAAILADAIDEEAAKDYYIDFMKDVVSSLPDDFELSAVEVQKYIGQKQK